MSDSIVIVFCSTIIFNMVFLVWLIFAVINRLDKADTDNIKMILENLRDHEEILQNYHKMYIRYIQEEIDAKKQIVSDLEDTLKQIDTLQDQLQELQSLGNKNNMECENNSNSIIYLCGELQKLNTYRREEEAQDD